jgi:hypothetical protein
MKNLQKERKSVSYQPLGLTNMTVGSVVVHRWLALSVLSVPHQRLALSVLELLWHTQISSKIILTYTNFIQNYSTYSNFIQNYSNILEFHPKSLYHSQFSFKFHSNLILRNQVVSSLVWLRWVIDMSRFEFEFKTFLWLYAITFIRVENCVFLSRGV